MKNKSKETKSAGAGFCSSSEGVNIRQSKTYSKMFAAVDLEISPFPK